jgi:hypothetical protein
VVALQKQLSVFIQEPGGKEFVQLFLFARQHKWFD